MRLVLSLVRASVTIVAIASRRLPPLLLPPTRAISNFAPSSCARTPRAPPSNETAFDNGLTGMVALYCNFGVKNVIAVIDEISDATKKINVGARDMFVSATSQMT